MASKWKRVTVADVCISIVDCVNKTAPVVEYPTNYKMIRTPNIRAGKVTLDGCRYVEKEVYETWTRRSKPQKGDVLLTREAPLGEVGIITTDENIFLGQRIMQYRADKNKIDPYFLLYSFLSPDLQQQFSMHEGSGSVVSHIRVGDCSKFEINIPPLEIQRSIVEILKSLDDHIDVNIKINQTLEQMSQTLFKSWFVDFDPVIDNALDAGNPIPEALQSRAELRQKVRNSADFKPLPADIRALFPAVFEETELGWVPKNWNIEALDSIANFQNGLALQKFRPGNNEEQYLPVLKIADLRAGYINNDERATVDIVDSCKVYDGDMIFSWSGTLMIDIWTGGNAALNQHLYKVTSQKYPQSFYLMWTKQHLSRFQHISEAKAVTMGHIKKGDLSNSLCLVPSSLLVNKYDNIVGKYYTQIKNQRLLNNQLTALRDTLLPKLISGELSLEDLPDLANQTEPA
ncbi:restriction endonuclease subunit S [Salmonella enterica subsp. enterica]|nr:restriction endonuclease subunit S [Salmonella enterica subsp. enterica serovar Coquilhatville]